MLRGGLFTLCLTLVACGGSKAATVDTTEPPSPVTTMAPTTTTIPRSFYSHLAQMTRDVFGGMDVEADNPSYFSAAQQESDCNLLVKGVDLMRRTAPPSDPRLASTWTPLIATTQRVYSACAARARAFTSSDWAIVKADYAAWGRAEDEFAAAFTAAP